ncbi:hypothetical protein K492DRAFT_170785 [Lichtheimia hyalospora FSU 10163]|nr:hypothetical protein K492DRAFT_170785 [Lichtheimia hyalospora FSU 10163]
MAHVPPHNSLRSVTANSSSSVFGLSLNKHGLSFQKPSSSPQNGRIAALPPLQLTVPVIGGEQESPSASRSFSSDTFKLQKQKQKETVHRPAMMSSMATVDGYFQRTKQQQQSLSAIVDSSQSLVFAAGTLHTAVRRCLALCTGSNNSVDLDIISDALGKSSISVEELVQALDDQDGRLERYASECIRHMQVLCVSLQQQVASLVPCLDPRFARHLLLTIHGTTVDIKEACETLQSSIQRPSSQQQQQQHLLSPDNAFKQPHPPPYLRTRSHSEHATASTASSPLDDRDRSQLHTHLKLAVTHSLHVTDLLKKSIDDTVAKDNCAPTLRQKLLNLGQQAQQAAGMAIRLDQGLKRITNKDTASSSIEGNKAFWEETNEYLKVIVSVMRGMQSISTQEDFGWPKAVKQGCLQVTRVTAEVAKVWNRYSASFTSTEPESSTTTTTTTTISENKTGSSISSSSDQ